MGKHLKNTLISDAAEEPDNGHFTFNTGLERLRHRGGKWRRPAKAKSSLEFVEQKRTCEEKVFYQRFCQVVHDTDQINQRVALMLNPMTPYRCKVHLGFYHKGHDKRMKPVQASLYLEHSRKRARERNRPTPLLDVKNIDSSLNTHAE